MSWVQAHLGFSSRYGVLGCGGSSFVGATYIEFVGPELFMICGNTFQYFVYHTIDLLRHLWICWTIAFTAIREVFLYDLVRFVAFAGI